MDKKKKIKKNNSSKFKLIQRFLRPVSGTGRHRHRPAQGIKSFILRFLPYNASKLL
jgi:hypothetical protein